jgi:hypothetical protein
MLLHHFRTPLARAPPPLPPPTPGQLAAAAAAAAAAASGSSAEAPQQHPLTRPDVVKCLRLMRGVGRGLLHLHTRQPAILHRDIKPANIFVGYGMQVRHPQPLALLLSPHCDTASSSSWQPVFHQLKFTTAYVNQPNYVMPDARPACADEDRRLRHGALCFPNLSRQQRQSEQEPLTPAL